MHLPGAASGSARTRKSLRNWPDAMPRKAPGKKKILPVGNASAAPFRRAVARVRRTACASGARASAQTIQLKRSTFFLRPRCDGMQGGVPTPARGVSGGDLWQGRGERPGKNFCAGVLTVKKTVIRFRPKQTLLPQRVSRIDIKVTSKHHASTPVPTKVETGLLPSAKTATSSHRAPVSAFDAGVSVSAASKSTARRYPRAESRRGLWFHWALNSIVH